MLNTMQGQNPVKLFRVDFSFNITMTSIQNMTIIDIMQHIHLKESKRSHLWARGWCVSQDLLNVFIWAMLQIIFMVQYLGQNRIQMRK